MSRNRQIFTTNFSLCEKWWGALNAGWLFRGTLEKNAVGKKIENIYKKVWFFPWMRWSKTKNSAGQCTGEGGKLLKNIYISDEKQLFPW